MKLKTKKYYKNLYEAELENRKKLINQCSKLSAENVDYQKEIQCYKEKCGKLTLDVEDLTKFLQQEKEAKEALKKERTKLKREITMLKKELNKDGK